jgi:hypothetical protein
MKNTIAYTSIEQIVVGDYKFNCDEYHFYDNEITAREEIEDFKEDNEFTYVAKVEIKTELFNIYNPIHRRQLLGIMPKYVGYRHMKVNKEVLVLSLMGQWTRDDYSLDVEDNYSTNELFDEANVKFFIKELGFNGYISMIDQLSQYTVFFPDNHVQIIRLSI